MRTLISALVAGLMLAALAGPVAAHPHKVANPSHDQVLANGQNHPGFVEDTESGLFTSCEGVQELPNSGPAGYGLETAHHGPDAEPGKADGCFATEGAPTDNNPAMD